MIKSTLSKLVKFAKFTKTRFAWVWRVTAPQNSILANASTHKNWKILACSPIHSIRPRVSQKKNFTNSIFLPETNVLVLTCQMNIIVIIERLKSSFDSSKVLSTSEGREISVITRNLRYLQIKNVSLKKWFVSSKCFYEVFVYIK